jgi:hypothetical protein
VRADDTGPTPRAEGQGAAGCPEDPEAPGGADPADRPVSRTLSQLRLGALLGEVQQRIGEIMETRDRLNSLLDAVLAVSAGLDLADTLRQIV